MSTDAGFWTRLRRLFTHGLVVHAGLTLLARSGLRIIPYLVYVEPPSEPDPHQLSGLTVERVTEQTLEAAIQLAGQETSVRAERWRKAIRRGEWMVLMRRDAVFIGFTWANLRVYRVHQARRALGPSEAYLRNTFVARRHRGRGLAVLLRHAMHEALATQGRRDFLSVSELFNTPARRFKTHLGARPIELRVQIAMRGWWRELCLWRAT